MDLVGLEKDHRGSFPSATVKRRRQEGHDWHPETATSDQEDTPRHQKYELRGVRRDEHSYFQLN